MGIDAANGEKVALIFLELIQCNRHGQQHGLHVAHMTPGVRAGIVAGLLVGIDLIRDAFRETGPRILQRPRDDNARIVQTDAYNGPRWRQLPVRMKGLRRRQRQRRGMRITHTRPTRRRIF